MKETIKILFSEWKSKNLPDAIPREIDLKKYMDIKPRKIVVVTGFRRVGKTYLLFGLIKKLLENAGREEVVYLNFEDERIELKIDFLTELLPTIRQFSKKDMKYLFLDEIQNMPQWSKWLRRIHESEDISIFVSGSSSKMSSKEIPTELRGRFLQVNVFPLSFNEFLTFRNLKFDIEDLHYSSNQKAKLLNVLDDYLNYGGLPEVVLSDDTKRNEIVNSYYQTVVRRDIIERNKVKNEEVMKAVLRLLLNSTQYSISKLFNTLKSLGYSVGKTTMQQYVNYIENSYFMFSIPIFSFKVKDQLMYPRKIYFIDNCFINLFSTKFSKNYGRIYENMVAVQLKRKLKNEEIYYWKSQSEEVDFVIVKDTKAKQLIQVCYDMSDRETKDREIRALIKASKELKCNSLIVITDDYEKEELVSWFGTKKKIKFIPLWKWLLQNRE